MNLVGRTPGNNNVWLLLLGLFTLFSVAGILLFWDTSGNAALSEEFARGIGVEAVSDFDSASAGFDLMQIEVLTFETLPPEYADMVFVEGYTLVEGPYIIFTSTATGYNNDYVEPITEVVIDGLNKLHQTATTEFELNLIAVEVAAFKEAMLDSMTQGTHEPFVEFMSNYPEVWAQMQDSPEFMQHAANLLSYGQLHAQIVELDSQNALNAVGVNSILNEFGMYGTLLEYDDVTTFAQMMSNYEERLNKALGN